MEWLSLVKLEEEKYLAYMQNQWEDLVEQRYQDTFNDWWKNYKN